MAYSTKATQIGVIAEEINDVEVIYEITCKIIKEEDFAFKRFVGHGCGKVRRKCRAWARILVERGCSHIVVVHDLDDREEETLRCELEEKIADLQFIYAVVLIPVREMEAWLLSDRQALKTVFNMRRLPRLPKWPETITNPKKFLADVVRNNSKSQYLNTIHNRRIARSISISNLDRCASFLRYPEFLGKIFP